MVQGSVNYKNGTGDFDMTIPLKGPKGDAILSATGHQLTGQSWNYSKMEAQLPNGSHIDLLGGGGETSDAETTPTDHAEPEVAETEATEPEEK